MILGEKREKPMESGTLSTSTIIELNRKNERIVRD